MITQFGNWRRQVGHRIQAREWNKLQREVHEERVGNTASFQSSMQAGVGTFESTPFPVRIRLVELIDDIGPDESSEFRDRRAYVMYWDDICRGWRCNDEDIVYVITDAYQHLIYDRGQRLLVFYHEQSGKYIPMPQITMRHVITVPDAAGNYPLCEDNPNTYAIAHISTEYNPAIGQQVLNMNYKDSINRLAPDPPHGGKVQNKDEDFVKPKGGTEDPCHKSVNGMDDIVGYVHNLICELPTTDTYIPCYTVVPAWFLMGQWYTWVHCPCKDSSSSSSSSSTSSSSVSASESSSSSSTSSESSSSSSSSSTSSQSRSTSSSSQSESETSTSSTSSSCLLYGPTASRVALDYLRLPRFKLTVSGGQVDCEATGNDDIYLCCDESESSAGISSSSP